MATRKPTHKMHTPKQYRGAYHEEVKLNPVPARAPDRDGKSRGYDEGGFSGKLPRK